MLRWVISSLPHLSPSPAMAPTDQGPGCLCLFSFPGGKCDRTDQDVVHTALRETQEELGLTVPEEHVWGILQPVYDQVRLPGPEATTRDKASGPGLWWSSRHLPGSHAPSPHRLSRKCILDPLDGGY